MKHAAVSTLSAPLQDQRQEGLSPHYASHSGATGLFFQKQRWLEAGRLLGTRTAAHCLRPMWPRNLTPGLARPQASKATVLVCLCPSVIWEEAIFGHFVLQTDQQSRKCPFPGPQLGWAGQAPPRLRNHAPGSSRMLQPVEHSHLRGVGGM